MNMMYRSHSVTTKSTTTTLLLLGIILTLLIIDPLSSTSTHNCRCCTEAFQQRVQYHTHYRAAAAAAAAAVARVQRYSQTEYEHYSVETTETFSTAAEYHQSQFQSAASTNTAPTVDHRRHTPINTDSSSPSCGVVVDVVAWPKLNNHENDDNDKFVFINSNEDIISSINNSIDSNEYDIASIWANSLEQKIQFHKGSRIWLEQKQQQQQTNAFDREDTKVGVAVNRKKIGTVTSDFPMYYI